MSRIPRACPYTDRAASDMVAAMADPSPSRSRLGPVDFSTHVLSLASSALIALGKMPAPDGEPHPLDLETART